MDIRTIARPAIAVAVIATALSLSLSPQASSFFRLNPSQPQASTWNPEFTGFVYSFTTNVLGHTVYTLNHNNQDGSTTGIFVETTGCNFTKGEQIRIQTRSDGQDIRFSPSQQVPVGCAIWEGPFTI